MATYKCHKSLPLCHCPVQYSNVSPALAYDMRNIGKGLSNVC